MWAKRLEPPSLILWQTQEKHYSPSMWHTGTYSDYFHISSETFTPFCGSNLDHIDWRSTWMDRRKHWWFWWHFGGKPPPRHHEIYCVAHEPLSLSSLLVPRGVCVTFRPSSSGRIFSCVKGRGRGIGKCCILLVTGCPSSNLQLLLMINIFLSLNHSLMSLYDLS